ncbi:MIP/aquaporin family protein [Geomonas azotofigens]|uniref:MIP/aquaporin family protein n=1 Tax=Geomonas azotofigens TaxID=2843196 RepID=UPI001C10B040|nr:MIP/aquaporin family protein [Geomonas azotofigens]MBU5613875.1 aquaporin family protein [Geomonas azotofigens]
MKSCHDFMGELIGTFLLVFFGCSSVAVAVLFSAHAGLFQIAMIWGIAVMIAIYATRHLSCAHLNPAISIAMVLGRRMALRKLPEYLAGQFIGAFVAAGVLYLLFSNSIAHFEVVNHILRGSPESVRTAQIFGEFYPNPGAGVAAAVSPLTAFLAEAIGTSVLAFLILSLTEGCNLGRPDDALAPVFIGLTVTILISIMAPLTQAGFNPARDLAPRLFSMLAGWKSAALPDKSFGFLTIYVLGPIIGASSAAGVFAFVVEPLMKGKGKAKSVCECA